MVRDPPESSLRLALDARNCFNGVKEILALRWVLDVPLDEKRVGLGVDVLHHNLEPIEITSPLNFIRKALEQVFVDNTIRGSEESEDMGVEVSFVVVHVVVLVVEIL